MGGSRNAHMVLAENHADKGHLEEVGVDGTITLQNRQCTYNVTLRYVRATTVAVEEE